MADPRPIEQHIKATADLSGLDQAAQGMDKFEKEALASARAALDAAESTEDQDKAIKQLSATLRKLHAEQVDVEQAQKRGVQISQEQQGEYDRRASRIRGLNRALAEQEDRQTELTRREREGIDAHRENTKETGFLAGATDRAVTSIASMAGTYLSLSAAANLALKALRDVREEEEAAAERQRQSRRGVASLGQLADTTEEMQVLLDKTRYVRAQGGARSDDEAARIVFGLYSAGQIDQLETVTALSSSGLIEDVDSAVQAVASLINAVGSEETGNLPSVLSKAIGAAKNNKTDIVGVLNAAASGGSSASQLAISDEELLALNAVLAGATKSSDIAGTQSKALLESLVRKGEFKGQPLEQSLLSIRDRGIDDSELGKFFGSSEALNAYSVAIKNLEQYRATIGDIDTAAAGDALGNKLAILDEFALLDAPRQAEKYEQRLEQAIEEKKGEAENLADAAEAELRRARVDAGADSWIRRQTEGLERYLAGDAAYLQSLEDLYDVAPDAPTLINRDVIEGFDPALMQRVRDFNARRQRARDLGLPFPEEPATPPSSSTLGSGGEITINNYNTTIGSQINQGRDPRTADIHEGRQD